MSHLGSNTAETARKVASASQRSATIRHIPVSFDCYINEKRFDIRGGIEIASGGGFAAAWCKFDRASLPEGFQPELLSYVAITGYPDASLKIGEAVNPFSDQQANFRTTRALDLGARGRLDAVYGSESRGTPDERIMFRVTGRVDLRERITAIEPLCELWTPSDEKDVFHGRMTFVWRLENGARIAGHAEGSYRVPGTIRLTKPQMRVITFDLESESDGFRQIEAIRLFDLAEWKSV